jgi:hypothetical protein
MAQRNFTCVIEDAELNDRFSAQVTVSKREVIRKSRATPQIELADIYITPISGQHAYYDSKTSWARTPARFQVATRETSGSHNHFVLYDFTGRGLYIVRDNCRREVHRRECSLWDLGSSFAFQVSRILQELA